MAEENPHIEITIPPKPINNPREKYYSENEKLILGRHGFIYKSFPTLKERYKEYKTNNRYDINNNSSDLYVNHSSNKMILKNNNIFNNKSPILKSNSQENIFLQPILRFKNRTDLERICDTIEKIAPQNELMSLKEIRLRHVNSIDFSKGSLSTKNISTSQNNLNLNSSNLTIRNINNNNIVDEQKVNNIKIIKKPKININRLQRLNAEAKKIRSNLHFKIHFKGVESVFINPKQIYDINKKDDIIIKKKIESYAFNDRKEKDAIEKYNEYKSDIDELLLEEKERQKIINSKEFSNILNNRNFFEYKENKNNQKEVEKTKKIRY